MNLKKKSYWRRIKVLFKKILTTNDSPHKLAMGFAIGVFWGVMPTFGFAIIFSLPTAVFLKANKVTAILGTFVSNPFTTPFFYAFSYKMGSFILRLHSFPFSWNIFNIFKIENILNITKSLLIGSVILAIITAFISYGLILIIILLIRKRKGLHSQYSKRSGRSGEG